ncbi:EAL domain-containing protein [Roseitranquillus sediminis]|uniref:EAL domain-containing protein n=1 Tax=Roseitranquillus sediminis TaxID=2809051 RepID=UPI001D0C2710|nr:EAL domain-containing protein [Roseitranquillus sediminis]MBM9595332.1 EAL domain-containing protein [Roseitranquillus sediminis]
MTAAVVCLTMALTVVVLMHHAASSEGRDRTRWQALIALCAGIGVWTTHFVAILGYRPDAGLIYDVGTTALSVLASLFFVGVPLAMGSSRRAPRVRASWGALTGVGVGGMHYTGMSALEGCIITNDPVLMAVALFSGCACFALALGLRGDRVAVGRVLLIVSGVCALHFTAMAGVSLEISSEVTGRTFDTGPLSAFVALTSLALSVSSFFALAAARSLRAKRNKASRREAQQNRLLSIAMRNMSNGLVMYGTDERIIALNDQAVTMMQLKTGRIGEGSTLTEMFQAIAEAERWSEARRDNRIRAFREYFSRTETTRFEVEIGSGQVLRVCCRPLAEGGAVLTYDDVTERRNAEAAMTEMACHDALTGLPNRRRFQDQVATMLRSGRERWVMMLDLDRFKAINETLGHHVGDMLLVSVSDRLVDAGLDGRLYRLGGDELAVLPDKEGGDSEEVAKLIVGSLAAPFTVHGHSIRISCSAGLVVAEETDNADILLQKADLALYRAKAKGRDRVERYEAGMMEKAQERRNLELDLAQATERGEFVMHYQPIYELPSKTLAGFEALARWEHPVRGRVAPADFIPLAEENGTIHHIGKWIIDETCRQAARWPEHIRIAMNVSAVQMRSPRIADDLASALARHDVCPGRLEIELTETAMVEDGCAIAASLCRLRRLGVRIAMDDFGTGYSSLAHLREFELDRIKIDRSFVAAIERDADARAVVRAVTSMAREMSITTVGEGVETREQLQRLIDLGCDAAQGFLLGRPALAAEAELVIAAHLFDNDARADAEAVSGGAVLRAVVA